MGIMQKKYQIHTILAQMMHKTKLAYELFAQRMSSFTKLFIFAEFSQIPQKNKLKQICDDSSCKNVSFSKYPKIVHLGFAN